MKFRRFLLAGLFLVSSFGCFSQKNSYVLYFKDKPNNAKDQLEDCISNAAMYRRMKNNISFDTFDLPVNRAYINAVRNHGAEILLVSKWLNCVVIQCDTLPDFTDCQFISRIIEITATGASISNNEDVSFAPAPSGNSYLDQLSIVNGLPLHENGFYGKGVVIAIMDDGFLRANEINGLQHLFKENRVVAAKNFLDNASIYNTGSGHGSCVLSIIAGKTNAFSGAAPNAQFMLFRTEDINRESLLEEYAWVVAAEYADSVGVDIISSSLNYSVMDDSSHSHSYSDMDGKTCPISIGAQIAASKGILVVSSAGNDGASEWKYVSAPADAQDVITVGGVTMEGNRWYGSSVGPTADGRIKPDICALSADVVMINPVNDNLLTMSGTSFAAPVIAGFFACMVEAFPNSPSSYLKHVVYNTSSDAETPNNEIGYGVPDFEQAYCIVGIVDPEAQFVNYRVYPNPFSSSVSISCTRPIYSVCVFSVDGQQLPFSEEIIDDTNVKLSLLSSYKGYVIIRIVLSNYHCKTFVTYRY
ncbi:MAG: S8 family serine peptidase [Bacteroidales bacterium]|nr:S8 family serine peptidase [Bacteroidales bacterium]